MQTEERITIELVREFVMAAHGDLERVQELLEKEARLDFLAEIEKRELKNKELKL
jgi:hypothetical protein